MFAASIALLLSAAASPSSYPGFETLTAVGDDKFLCTSDGEICISSSEPGVLTIMRGDNELTRWSPDTKNDDVTFEPMPALIRLADGRVLVGALVTHQTSYSGGGQRDGPGACPARAGQGDQAGTDGAGGWQLVDPCLFHRKAIQRPGRRM